MTSRQTPFRNRPPSSWADDILALQQSRLFLVSKPGPLAFILKTETDSIFKCVIGNTQMCSCGMGVSRERLCCHLLFVLLKVLKIPKNCPLAWQLSFVDSEICQVLSFGTSRKNENQRATASFEYLKRGNSVNVKDAHHLPSMNTLCKKVNRKDLADESTCTICQEEMTHVEQLCFCEYQCGTQFHIKCFRMYASFNRSNKKPITCPICRIKWVKVPELKMSGKKNKFFRGIICRGCKTTIRKQIYRCASCTTCPYFDLCRGCFEGGAACRLSHGKCCFVVFSISATPSWRPALVSNGLKVRVPPIYSVARELMHREITNLDYDILLALDDGGGANETAVTLESHLLSALKPVRGRGKAADELNEMSCTVCSHSTKAMPMPTSTMKQLCCPGHHAAHGACALSLLMEANSSDVVFGAAAAQCPECRIKEKGYLFPNLMPSGGDAEKNRIRKEMNENGNATGHGTTATMRTKHENQGNSAQITSLLQVRMGMLTLSLSGHSIAKPIPRNTKGSRECKMLGDSCQARSGKSSSIQKMPADSTSCITGVIGKNLQRK
mmetsp:Transcript_176/g.280  ORF Transcript_176/g.280 Transcript_176/m.280 type:complete len:554 (-) Transcript_176:143-1804(-)